jgi:enoyl reductase-like protein
MRAGGKPVPFVPAIDADFEEYFKKDSLWFSEDLAAVVGRDAGRVCILQEPVAVRHSTVANEPVGDILRGIKPGMMAALTEVPVFGVPVPSKYLRGEDSLLSIVQMPKGIPVATFAIGEAGAANAALHVIANLATTDGALREQLRAFRARQTETARAMKVPL